MVNGIAQTLALTGVECRSFLKSGIGSILIYIVLIPLWAWMIHTNITGKPTDYLWLVFFSVIVCGNFTQTLFASERMRGSIEIMLTSGLSRTAILAGKSLFVVGVAVSMGAACFIGALLMVTASANTLDWVALFALYVGASVMNTMLDAWLSLTLSNPRLVSVINLFGLMVISIAAEILRLFVNWQWWWGVLFCGLISVLFWILSLKALGSERVIRPVV